MEGYEYPWNTPLDWLLDHLRELDHQSLWNEIQEIVRILAFDDIQDLYQNDMENDGFFTPIGWHDACEGEE